jgi:hypothetical protein
MPVSEMILAPIDRISIDVHSMELRIRVAKKPCDRAPAPATKIEHSMRTPNGDPHVIHPLANQTCTALPDAQKLAHRK